MSKISLVQSTKFLLALTAAADAAGRTSPYISLKNTAKAYAVCKVAQGNAAPVTFSVMQATNVAGAGAKALGKAVPIFANFAAATTEPMVRQVDGVAQSTGAALADKIIIFEIDGTMLDVNAGFDCIAISTGASNAGNITDVTWMLAGQRQGGENMFPARVD